MWLHVQGERTLKIKEISKKITYYSALTVALTTFRIQADKLVTLAVGYFPSNASLSISQ